MGIYNFKIFTKLNKCCKHYRWEKICNFTQNKENFKNVYLHYLHITINVYLRNKRSSGGHRAQDSSGQICSRVKIEDIHHEQLEHKKDPRSEKNRELSPKLARNREINQRTVRNRESNSKPKEDKSITQLKTKQLYNRRSCKNNLEDTQVYRDNLSFILTLTALR